jgi:hypothetical protein
MYRDVNSMYRDVSKVFGHCDFLLYISCKTTFFKNIIPKSTLVRFWWFFIRPSSKTGRIMVYRLSVRPIPWPIHFKLRTDIGIDGLTVCILFGEISNFHSRVMGLYSSNCRQFFVSRCKLRTPWPIHFKLRIVIGIDSLMICILFGEISIFHSRVMGLYSSNCRRFFVCRAVNWEPLRQFTSNFTQLLELLVLRSVYFLVKFRFFIPELWDFIHQIVGDFSYVAL